LHPQLLSQRNHRGFQLLNLIGELGGRTLELAPAVGPQLLHLVAQRSDSLVKLGDLQAGFQFGMLQGLLVRPPHFFHLGPHGNDRRLQGNGLIVVFHGFMLRTFHKAGL
jgi:hypothetical protein